jgi:hypothetical protein
MKRLLIAFSCLFLFSTNAFSGNYTGIWWNSSESGWGVNFSQQGDVLFAAMYVYDPSGRATWYSSSMRATMAAPMTFSGDLVATTGPYFGGAFNAGAVASRTVGKMNFNGPSFNRGTLTYSVDGVSVSKTIDQLAFERAPLTGTYAINVVRDATSTCVIPGLAAATTTRLVVTGNALQLQNSAGGAICNAQGSAGQAGAMYVFVSDAPSCLPGSRLTVLDLKAEGVAGLTNANVLLTAAYVFVGANQSCSSVYYLAGVRIQ